MRRETRVNLIFLAAFLVISLPGAVILVRKKLQPGAPRMDQPDVIVTRLPFMTPPPNPPGVRWIVPDLTRAWLEQVTQERTGRSRMLSTAPPGPQWEPVISDDHLLQAIAVSDSGGARRLALLLWNGQIDSEASHYAVTINGAPARILDVQEIAVPANVRHELVRLDYPRPPEHVIWMEAESNDSAASAPKTKVTLAYDGPPAPLHTSLEINVK